MEVNEISPDTKKSFKTRVISAIILVAITVPAFLLGGWIFFIIAVAGSALCVYEILHAPRNEKKYDIFINVVVYVMFFVIAFWMLLKHNLITLRAGDTEGRVWWSFSDSFFTAFPDGNGGVASLEVSSIGIAGILLLLFLYSILKPDFDVKDVFYLFTMLILVGFGIESLMFLRYFPEGVFASYTYGTYNWNWLSTSSLLFYVLFITIMTDTFAYLTGVLFGKHKMNPRISPKKTWEGFWGGIGFAVIFGILYLLFFSLAGYPVLPIFDVIGNPKCWFNVVLLSLILPFVATLGDFLFSAIKRHFGIKDYSNLIPGHGGVLDRLDSITCASIVATIVIVLINNNWSFLA